MPYKYNDPWHYQQREYLMEIKGTVSDDTLQTYGWRLDMCGRVLDYADPRKIPLARLRALEQELPGEEGNRAILAQAFRTFAVWSGNRDALRWRISVKSRPKVGGVFMSEHQVREVREVANSLGPFHALIFSLGVDNGLRTIDMRRLTMQNAVELIRFDASEILGKGRNGGKVGHLELSRMTRKPLADYMEMRRAIVDRWGRDWTELLIMERKKTPRRAGPPGYNFIADRGKEISQLSGIAFDMHDLRRTYGNRLHKAGVPIETIARLMRHENINQAFRAYIGIDADEMRLAQNRLCPDS